MKSAKGSFKNIYAVRFEPGEDVQNKLLEFCREKNLGHGVIISAIGSLQGCSFFDPEELKDKPGYYAYGDPIEYPCPIELIAMNGIICTEEDGTISTHIHASFADTQGNEYGGHFKEGNKVLTTVEMVIGEMDHINMSRKLEPIRGVKVFEPIEY